MNEILEKLNEVQKEAVKYNDGPLLILAGAGSGKTRVLTYKIAYLLDISFCMPYEILAITFTNKAAKEMKERVESLVKENAKDIWLGTFHSICVRILKREIEKLGYSKDFNILDEQDKQKVLKKIIKEENIDDKQFLLSFFIREISSAKDKIISAEEYRLQNMSDFRKEKVALVYEKYQKYLKQNNALDFDDLLCKTVEIFTKYEDVLAKYQNKFKYILVDEYQDTSHVQFLLITLLAKAHQKICVVGDESQSIYGFRGADISNILEFEKTYKNAKIFKLEQNYRSTKNILEAANKVISNNMNKIDKNLWTENEEGEKISVYQAKNEYDEIIYIVDEIDKEIRKGSLNYGDVAILYRTNAQSRVIEEIFLREGIPYKLIGGTKFYLRKEIKDTVAYMKLINNTLDNLSLERIINEPKRGIGDTTVDKIRLAANAQNMSMFEYLLNPENIESYRCSKDLNNFIQIVKEIIQKKEELTLPELIKKIIKDTGYEEELIKDSSKEAESRIENIYEFISSAAEFENEMVDNSLADFLDSIALVSDVDSLEDESQKVTLMTMHNAKGLEYPIIFLCGLEEGLFPSSKSMENPNDIEEERRLCYVGITRAKKRLYLTFSKQRTLYGSTTYTILSRFLEEIPEALLNQSMKDLLSSNIKTSPYTDYSYTAVNKLASSQIASYKKEKADETKLSFGKNVNDFLKGIKRSEEVYSNKNTAIENSELSWIKEDVKVNHKKFGEGIVKKIEVEDDDIKVDIDFEKFGLKRLMAKHAGLERI